MMLRCPLCDSTRIAVARDGLATRYCQNCFYKWVPPLVVKPKEETLEERLERVTAAYAHLSLALHNGIAHCGTSCDDYLAERFREAINRAEKILKGDA